MAELCFNTMCHSAWLGIDARLPEQVVAAAGAGYRLLGPDLFSLRQLEAQGTSFATFADQVARAGMRCFELAALGVTDDRAATLADARDLARAVRALGPEWVMVNCWPAVDAPGVAELFDECAAVLADAGAGLAFEFLPFTGMASIASARALLQRARAAGHRAGLVLDTWHVFRGPDGLAGVEALDLADVAYVQFDDARPMLGDDLTEETLHRRALPGEGELPLTEFCAALRAKGWDGVVSVEILDAEWRVRPLPEFAAATFDATRRYWPAG